MHRVRVSWLVCFLGLCFSGSVSGDDWPRWLGEKGDGVWREEGILKSIPDSGLKLKWETPIAGGYSGPAVANGHVFVMDFVRESSTPPQPGQLSKVTGTERVLCMNAVTGEEVWKHEYETILEISYPGGPRSTPFVEGEMVYAQGTMGELMCFEAASGKVIWELNVAERYKTRPPIWGYASHPLVVDDLLIVSAGGEGSGIVALEKSTGKEVWKAITAQEIGYAPLVLSEIAGKQQLVVWYDVALVGLDVDTGEQLWSYAFPIEKPQRPIVAIVPPTVVDDRVFITNFYHGSALVHIDHDSEAEAEWQAKEIWSTEKNKSVKGDKRDINSIMSSVLFEDEHFIGVAGNGEMRCVSAKDASLIWQSYQALAAEGEDPTKTPRGNRGFPAMFMTPQGDNYWLFTDLGDLILSKIDVDGYTELGRTHLLDTTGETRGRKYVWCHPAYANGHIYVRNEKKLACFDLRAGSYPL